MADWRSQSLLLSLHLGTPRKSADEPKTVLVNKGALDSVAWSSSSRTLWSVAGQGALSTSSRIRKWAIRWQRARGHILLGCGAHLDQILRGQNT